MKRDEWMGRPGVERPQIFVIFWLSIQKSVNDRHVSAPVRPAAKLLPLFPISSNNGQYLSGFCRFHLSCPVLIL